MSGVEVYKDKIIRINVIGERTEHPLHDIVHAIWEPILYWDEALTLRDIFAVVAANKDIWKYILQNRAVFEDGGFLDEYAELDEDKVNCIPGHIYVKIWCALEHHYMDEDNLDLLQLNRSIWVGGQEKGEEDNFCVDFLSLSAIIDMPVVLEEKCGLWDDVNYKWMAEDIDARYSYSVIDVFHGIFWELTFYGNPSERDATAKELDLLSTSVELD